MKNFGEWLSRLGHLHDCAVTLIEWRPNQRTIGFDIEDLYFNFENLPEYPGPLAGRIALQQLEQLAIDVDDMAGPLRIHEFSD